jgi:hypothetical protein
VVVDGIVVGCAFSLIIEYADFGDDHTYAEITSDMIFDNHAPKGDSLYRIEVLSTLVIVVYVWLDVCTTRVNNFAKTSIYALL